MNFITKCQFYRYVCTLCACVFAGNLSAAGGEAGPFYGAAAVFQRNGGEVTQLSKFWADEDDDRATRTINFVAPIEFMAGTPGSPEGTVRLGTARKLLTDPKGIYSNIVPVEGSPLVIEIQSIERDHTTIAVVGPAPDEKRPLARFPMNYRDPNDGACAVTPSGKYVLLVNENRIAIWDVVGWRELDRNVGPLGEMLKVMIDKFGNPGSWWLTDDLRYIVAAPSQYAWTVDGLGGETNVELALHGVKFSLSTDGVVFDRQTHALSKFPKSLQGIPASEIVDARSVGGKLQFLYSARTPELTVAVADDGGHVRAKHVLRTLRFKQLEGWRPERDEVYLQVRDADTWLPGDEPQANRHLIVWDVAHDQEHRYLVQPEQVRRAIEGK